MKSSIAFYLVGHVIKSNYLDRDFFAIFLIPCTKYPGITLEIRSKQFNTHACQFITL